MTGKKAPGSIGPGQVPSGPGNPDQGANWMPPQGGMGSQQSQVMPNQNAQQWNGFLPMMPGAGPVQAGGKTLFGKNGVSGSGKGGAMGSMPGGS